jgi:hypothetical protein
MIRRVPQLRRPLLSFTRSETAQICSELQVPVWIDPSNSSTRPARNRIRHHVLPILEELYPGCSERNGQFRRADIPHAGHSSRNHRPGSQTLNDPQLSRPTTVETTCSIDTLTALSQVAATRDRTSNPSQILEQNWILSPCQDGHNHSVGRWMGYQS